MARKRLYKLAYRETHKPIYVEDAGNTLKLSGVLLQGMGTSVLLLSPTANDATMPEIVQPTIEEWCEIIRRTDDPLAFEEDETGTIKAIHRKQERAISGTVQQRIWARDRFQCMYCGVTMAQSALAVDHFVPLELGGQDEESNYLTACFKCNKRKGSQAPEDFCAASGLDFEGLRMYLDGRASKAMIAHPL